MGLGFMGFMLKITFWAIFDHDLWHDKLPMTDPWDERYIYLHEWLIFMVNVGMYIYIYHTWILWVRVLNLLI